MSVKEERTTYTTGIQSPGLDEEFESALMEARAESGAACAHLVGGEWREDGVVFEREDPAHKQRTASRACSADAELVGEAVAAAREAFVGWRRLTVAQRCEHLRNIAEALRDRRLEIAALITLETGKIRAESIAEVHEAIDLIDTYCRQVEEHGGFEQTLGQLSPTERNRSILKPYGVFGVVSPFNFPLALAVGMSAGALSGGNTVVLKPSEETPRTGDAIARAVAAAGLPSGVLNLVHGAADTGAALVESALDGVAFTGSAEVGLAIARKLAGGRFTRPVIAEMGGKNPTIVTSHADLDAAADGIVRAAFGFSGQKCSSCSRVIVSEDVHDDLVERLVTAAASLQVGDAADRDVAVGPVIDAPAVERFLAAAAEARRDGIVALGGETLDEDGYFVAPTIVTDLPVGHRLTRQELFAPLLAITKAASLDDALAEANAVDYGLTAGIFSQEEAEVQEFLDTIEAGVVYVNRRAGATTGAWPGIQSFCGWKASGVTGKGGLGPYYVAQFMREQSQTVVAE